MNRLRHPGGFTMVEALLAVTITTIVALCIAALGSKASIMMKRMAVRQQVMQDAQRCVDVILQVLRQAKLNTVVISTPASTPVLPNSRIDFGLRTPLGSGTTAYMIYLSTDGVVYAKEYGGPANRASKVLASYVTSLTFTTPTADPSRISFALRIDAPWDKSGDPTRVSSIVMPAQLVQLRDSQ